MEDELPIPLYKQDIPPVWKTKGFFKALTGQALVITGSATSTVGALINNLCLDHIAAMHIWQISNLFLLAWAFGFWRKWWTNGIGAVALIIMYATFFISNEIGLYW